MLCEEKLQEIESFVGEQLGSLRLMEPIPYFVMDSTGILSEIVLCFSSQVLIITFSMASATSYMRSKNKLNKNPMPAKFFYLLYSRSL